MEPPKNLHIVSEQEFYAKDLSKSSKDLSSTVTKNMSKDLLNEYTFLILCVAVLVMVYCLYKYTK